MVQRVLANALHYAIIIPMGYNLTKFMWKEDLPANCPCNNAIEQDNYDCYRLVDFNPVQAKDFDCYYNQNIEKRPQYEKKAHTHCLSKGLSVYSTEDQARAGSKLPALKDKKFISLLKLQKSSGSVSEANEHGHMTWWLYKDADPVVLVQKVVPV